MSGIVDLQRLLSYLLMPMPVLACRVILDRICCAGGGAHRGHDARRRGPAAHAHAVARGAAHAVAAGHAWVVRARAGLIAL